MAFSTGIVGTGRMARALGALLNSRGVPVSAIAGRRPEAAREAAEFTGAQTGTRIADLPEIATHILICVSDDAVPDVAHELMRGKRGPEVVLHTCGAYGPEALEMLGASGISVGVLHPLQTVPDARQGVSALPGSTFAYAGGTEAESWARDLIKALDGKPLQVAADRWQQYHASAVMACNYPVALMDAALELMQAAGLSCEEGLRALTPLVKATIENILERGPEAALTGPIRRGDALTVRRHMKALEDVEPDTKRLYSAAGVRTLRLAVRAGLSEARAEAVRVALQA